MFNLANANCRVDTWVSASVWAEVGRVLVGWPMTYRSENNLRETVIDDQRSEQ
jgi:hypothetical protein